jgi:hypothetical protein
MNIFRKLPSFERTKPQLAVGCWVVELAWIERCWEGAGWRSFSFGVFRIERGVDEGERMLTPHTIRGFRREYRIWLPWIRVR